MCPPTPPPPAPLNARSFHRVNCSPRERGSVNQLHLVLVPMPQPSGFQKDQARPLWDDICQGCSWWGEEGCCLKCGLSVARHNSSSLLHDGSLVASGLRFECGLYLSKMLKQWRYLCASSTPDMALGPFSRENGCYLWFLALSWIKLVNG